MDFSDYEARIDCARAKANRAKRAGIAGVATATVTMGPALGVAVIAVATGAAKGPIEHLAAAEAALERAMNAGSRKAREHHLDALDRALEAAGC